MRRARRTPGRGTRTSRSRARPSGAAIAAICASTSSGVCDAAERRAHARVAEQLDQPGAVLRPDRLAAHTTCVENHTFGQDGRSDADIASSDARPPLDPTRRRPARDAARRGLRDRPGGVPGDHRLERPRQPDRDRVRRRRARVRGREARADRQLRLARRPDADGRRGPLERGPRLLGPRPARDGARPGVHHRAAVHLRPLHVQQGPVRRRVPALAGQLPDAAGRDRRRLRRLRPALAPDARGRRDAADHRLVPAVPEPLGRRPRLRARARALRLRRRRRLVQLRRLRPGRRAGQPVRRPRRRGAHAADRGGRSAARPGRPHVRRPHRRGRRDPPRRPGHGRRAARQPRRRQRRPDDAPDRRARLPQPVPAHAPPRHRRGLGRRRRLERVGGGRPRRRPDRGRRQLRLAVLRGRRPDGLLRQPEPEPVRDALRAGGRLRRDAALHLPARRQGRRGRGLPGRRLGDLGAPVLHRHALPGGVPRRPVLRGLHAQLHLVHAEGRRRPARPGPAPDLRLRRDRDREPDPGTGRQPLLPRPQRRHRQADQLRLAQRRADGARDGDAGERRRPARRPVRRHRPRRTRTATR